VTNLKTERQYLKSRLDREMVSNILTFVGYNINRQYKFKIREEEHTPSASIRSDGYIKDFGDGWGGDLVAFLHEKKGLSLKDAIEYIKNCIGENND